MQDEVWKDVVSWEGQYQISSLGLVRSLARYDGSGFWRKEKFLSPVLNSRKNPRSAYLWVRFFKKGEWTRFFIHRLVAAAFLPNPENKPYVNHIDGQKLNNTPLNLEWVTGEENRAHAKETGLTARGERAGKTKLTESEVRQLRKLRAEGMSGPKLGAKFGIHVSSVYAILNGRNWKHLKEYD